MTSSVLTLPKKFALYETIIINLFNQLPHGRLTIECADGRRFHFGDGHEVKANIQVTNSGFFMKCVLYGDIGFAESYLDGDWHTPNISDVVKWFIINLEHNAWLSGKGIRRFTGNFMRVVNKLHHASRKNTLVGSKKNIVEHYDLGNEFYSLFLDKTMTYSSGIFLAPETTLEESQFEKYDRLCRMLKLKSSDRVLEIGSGWGGFAVHAAKNYGCQITTVTISEEQYKYANERFEKEGLSGHINIQLKDYRLLDGKYDKIVSIEMLEAVGHEYLPVYFAKCNSLLEEDGALALQVITSRDRRYAQFRKDVDFIQKHIFPGSQTPSLSAIQQAITKVSNMTLFDLKDIGLDYARTLNFWFNAFNQKIAEVKDLGMDDRFIRKWNYYLQYCEAAFRERHVSVVQLVYAQPKNLEI
jgi:cyclopropane-fatty-acyl-phospholipid synthase